MLDLARKFVAVILIELKPCLSRIFPRTFLETHCNLQLSELKVLRLTIGTTESICDLSALKKGKLHMLRKLIGSIHHHLTDQKRDKETEVLNSILIRRNRVLKTVHTGSVS